MKLPELWAKAKVGNEGSSSPKQIPGFRVARAPWLWPARSREALKEKVLGPPG